VSRTVHDLVAGSGLAFEPRGVRRLGADGERWEIFAPQLATPASV
jgi:hypothetical protein